MAKAKPTSARTRPTSARTLQPHRDHIRIVPLYPGAAKLQQAAAPKLTYRNGPLLGAVEVFTVFWGDGWKGAPQNAMIPRINAFFDFVLTSALIDQLAEYSTSGTKIGHGRRTGTVAITGKLT